MGAYIVRRLLQAIPTVFGVALLTFLLFNAFGPDPVRTAPHQAKPVPPPAPAPIKPTEASTVRPRSLSTSPERQITGVCSVHGVPAAIREPTAIDRPS